MKPRLVVQFSTVGCTPLRGKSYVIHVHYELYVRFLIASVNYQSSHAHYRYLSRLKSYVRNKAAPEWCIAEGYIVEECLTFCSRYMEGVETIFNRPTRTMEESTGAVSSVILDNKEFTQAHRYVLFNSENIYQFCE